MSVSPEPGRGGPGPECQPRPTRDWTGSVLYSVIIDRFASPSRPDRGLPVSCDPALSPDGRHGGDMRSLAARLDYIAGLGVTGLLLNPLYQNQPGGYHGYWPTDFGAMDQALGSLQELHDLVGGAHYRGLDLFLDVIANHTGYQHPWTRDRERRHWFHRRGPIVDWNHQTELEEGDLAGLPDLAQEVPEVAAYLLENVAWWLGVSRADGLRIDAAKHIPKWFLRQLSQRVKRTRPGALILGEVAHGDRRVLRGYHAAGLDALFDFPLCGALREGFREGGDLTVLAREIDGRTGGAGNPGYWATFLDNHDMPRFRHIAGPGETGLHRLRQALTALLTLPGVPVIYYGTECGMEGGPDPDCRRPMAWGEDPELTRFFRYLVRLRRATPAFRTGRVRVLSASRDTLVYEVAAPGQAEPVRLTLNRVRPRREPGRKYRSCR